MANNQDARPFVDLQKDSEEFVAKFVEDIEECKSLLDAKITSLICDPDSIGHSVGPKQNALVEFSKAKYEIFVKMKSFMNEKEKEWQKYISEMKKLFLENVEIFLAGTKLEIKLPASEYQSSAGLKKSPGSRKSVGVASSIYPIISSITKKIPALSSSIQRKEVRNTQPKESFSRLNAYSAEPMDTDESDTDEETLKMPVRSIRRKTVNERVIEAETSMSPKKVTFTEEDLSDDLDVPVTKPSKSAARRKTLLPNLEEAESGADIIPGNSTRARNKRKTISGVAELISVAPSKRLKASSSQKSNAQDEGSSADDNLLEINDSYSDWIPLKSIDGKIPTTPAIYEVKVWRAKKTAFIGSCDSLRQKLTLHKLRQNSGHKHLDKFIERNFNDIQVRYEVVSSVNDAKVEVKNRINNFVAEYKTTPAYN